MLGVQGGMQQKREPRNSGMSATEELDIQSAVAAIWSDRSLSPGDTLIRSQQLLDTYLKKLTTAQLMKLQTARAVAFAMQNRVPEAAEAAAAAESQTHEHLTVEPDVSFELRRIRGRQALQANREAEGLKLTL